MKFKFVSQKWPDNFAMIYLPDEYSFSADPQPSGGVTSILVNDLQLEIDDFGRLLYVWGLCPHTSWLPSEEEPPEYVQGLLIVDNEKILIPGISHRLTGNTRWPVFANANTGWICIRDSAWKGDLSKAVEFGPGCVAVLRDQQLVALWLHPRSFSL
jgi:hypothetical protein